MSAKRENKVDQKVLGTGDHQFGHGGCCRWKWRSCGRKRKIVRITIFETIKMHTTTNSYKLSPRSGTNGEPGATRRRWTLGHVRLAGGIIVGEVAIGKNN